MAVMKMPTYAGGGGSGSNNLIFADWENTNQNSYLIYNDTTYNVVAGSSPNFIITIPDVLYCYYTGNNVWQMTNLTGKTMTFYYRNTSVQITTNTSVTVPPSDGGNMAYGTYVISE